VASAVGAMMCVLMRVRDADALARACDLGVAMQLTNIARDVGEDARAGRLYLPLDWIAEAGLTPEAFMAQDMATPQTQRMVRRLLAEARRLYIRSEAGISALPLQARAGIYAARYVYAGIGHAAKRNGYDTITMRAHTSKAQKLGWVMKAGLRAAGTIVMPQSPVIYAAPLPEVAFLVDATKSGLGGATQGRTAALLGVLADLDARAQPSNIAAE
jgi:phytoene synthase